MSALPCLVAELSAFGRGDIAIAGGKGANLGELMRAGFPAPTGFVVTTHAYTLAVQRAGGLGSLASTLQSVDPSEIQALAVACHAIQEKFAAVSVQVEVADAVRAACRRLGPGPVAVRSSATAEDLPGAAFAGQQETFLNVVGDDAVLDAVRRCWASLWSERAISYRARRQVEQGGVTMAVVVQRMVMADVAGVLFTANPLTGSRDDLVIDASPGLGEAVVAGLVSPDHIVLSKRPLAIRERLLGRQEVAIRPLSAGGTEETRTPTPSVANAEGCLSDADVAELASFALAVERHFGSPQDIEWAIAGGERYLLQARPMTALPEPVTWTPPAPGHWMRNFRLGEWLPEAMTPLFQDWLLGRIEEGYLLGMRKTIGTAVPFRHAALNGWYFNVPPPIGPFKILRAVVESRGKVFPFLLNALVRVSTKPEQADRAVLRGLAEE